MNPTPILFLDLDGTVRLGPAERNGKFVNGPEDVEIFDGVVDIIKSYKSRGWRIVAISNQGGVGLGLVSSQRVMQALQETNRLCANLFDIMQVCFHHPNAQDKDSAICLCRKPNIGMVVAAMIALSERFDDYYRPDVCLMVGDMDNDKDCAANANMQFMWSDKWREKGQLTT